MRREVRDNQFGNAACRRKARLFGQRGRAGAGQRGKRRPTNLLESLERREVMAADLVISEFMASPTNQPGNIQDVDGTYSDWIEVHNTTNQPLDLEGWTLRDSEDVWTFPAQTLAANGYLVVFASNKDRRTPGQELHTNFKLGSSNDSLALVAPDGITFASEFDDYPDQFNNISYGPNSAFTANGFFTTPSPGQPNTSEPVANAAKNIVINEIMYHPSTENDQHEFIELVNRGVSSVNLQGWQLTAGVAFTFGNVTLAPNQFLVIASNTAAFTARYGAVTNLVGGWTGTLSNTGEKIELSDNLGEVVDEVEYYDEGDWSTRIEVFEGGLSYDWDSSTDGGGRTLELRNWQLTNENGQNWGPSNAANGTPGLQNSINAANIAPLIEDVDQSIDVPAANVPVIITADVTDESATGLVVNLRLRTGTGVFNTTPMFDDGAHGDGAAGDNEYGATINGFSDGTIVEYYVEARDNSNQTRTWPAPARRQDNTLGQITNALYRVDTANANLVNNWTPGREPTFLFIMTAAEYQRFQNLSRQVDAQGHGTFVAIDGTGSSVRHNAGVRTRGESSRTFDPPPLRMEVPHDNPWHGWSDFNLNSKYPELQMVGSAFMRASGLQSAAGTEIQLRVNGVNGAFDQFNTPPQFGSYIWLEAFNGEYLDQHVPNDSGGNIYKKKRPATQWAYRNGNVNQYLADGWEKNTNSSDNDWTDLDNLMRVLNGSTAGPDYYADINSVANVDQWVRWFAAMQIMDSRETNLSNGTDDDYQIYRGVNDPRFVLFPHDLDTVFGQGENASGNTTRTVFQPILNDGEFLPQLIPFFNDPTIVQMYWAAIKEVVETSFSKAQFDPMVRRALGEPGDPTAWAAVEGTEIINWADQRRAFLQNLIPDTFTVSSSLATSNGYPRSTTATASAISGTADATRTRSVRIDGQLATWNGQAGTWAAPTITLNPGINRLMVQAFAGVSGTGEMVDETFIDVWYDDGSVTNISGTLAANTTWSPEQGPYVVTGNVTVPAGGTLTIQPGTTVFFNVGTSITVAAASGATPGGTIIAEGTQHQRIHFTRNPGVNNSNWGGFIINNANNNRFSYFNQEYVGGSGARGFDINNGKATFDHGMWRNLTVSAVEGSNSSFNVTNSFLGGSGAETLHATSFPAVGGEMIIRGNTFGPVTGYTDVIDITGAQLGETTIPQIIDNVFLGSEDDFLDLDGTDVVVVGNVFWGSGLADDDLDNPDTSSAVSGGWNQSDHSESSHYWVMGNYFYDNDHAFLAKEGNFVTAVNNTIIKNRLSVVNFDEPGNPTTEGPGLGAHFENNIIWDTPLVFENPTGMQITAINNIMPANPYSNSGPGNIDIDPHLVKLVNITNLKSDLKLLAGGPGVGTGTQGQNRGADVPWGIPIGGEPAAQTAQTSATLSVGNPFWDKYMYRVNGGVWSAEIPVGTPIQLNNLANGSYTVQVIGKNFAGVWQAEAAATSSKTWTVNTALQSVIINEVLANNTSAVPHGQTFPDLIELYNAGASAVDLGGMSISDSDTNKTKYIFPAGTVLNPGQHLVLYADSAVVVGEHHLGFSLDGSGDGVYLYAAGVGRPLVDSVVFGQQVSNSSVGRVGQDRHWDLNEPTFGAANVRQATGRTDTLKINEWLADGDVRIPEDYIELYNPDTLPVNLTGLYLTDEAVGDPQRYALPALSFIAANGYVAYTADDGDGGDNLPFQLSSDHEHLGLLAADGTQIDRVLYFQQTTDISQGMLPNGSSNRKFETLPTPDVENPSPPQSTSPTLIHWNDTWRYNESGDQGTAWKNPTFNDSGWAQGQGIIARETRGSIPFQTPGLLPGTPAGNTGGTDLTQTRMTYYFRKTFTLNANPAAATVKFQHLIDDGAIIYINGVELTDLNGNPQRIRMPAGTVSYNTPASQQINNTGYSSEITIPSSMLVQGQNVIAVEVHNFTIDNPDVVFGMNVTAIVPAEALDIVPLRAPKLFNDLRITEIMYNPLGGAGGEYIELQNTGTLPINLSGVRISGGVDFTFPNLILAAGARTVVVGDLATFQARFGTSISVAGEFAGDLSNGGEDLTLQLPDPYDAGILRFDYNDVWYPSTDGGGYALLLNSTSTPARDFDQKETWRAGSSVLGSPGAADVTAASLNGQILDDPNANGVQDNGETGRQGVEVSLYFAGADGLVGGTGDVLVGTITTNTSGAYSFSGLTPGAYYLSAVAPAGLAFSPINQGSNDNADSDFGPFTGRTAVFTLTAGQNDTSIDGLLSVPVQGAAVVDRFVFYNQSTFDGNNAAANAADDGAIAPDKVALLPGGTASFANYTNYVRGINGLMIDVIGLVGTPTVGDFTFRVGNDNSPAGWALLATAPSISVRQGAGVGGSDRITLIWPEAAIAKQWLQVTMNASDNTGLALPDVFYFGNAIGEAGNSTTNAQVTAIDEIFARTNPRSSTNPADISFPYDYNRDARVSATDQIIARNNRTTITNRLNLITVPGSSSPGLTGQGLAAQGLADSNLGDAASELARGLAAPASLAAGGSATVAGGSLTGQVQTARLQPQALSAAYEVADASTMKRRAAAAITQVDDDLLALIATGR